MTQLLIFFAILSLVIFFHELGHFWVAKKLGVKVEEFGFGYPPRIFGKKFKGTIYSINLIPLGGFVRLKGQDMEVLGVGDSDSFSVKPPTRRLAILLAGVAGNFVLAWLLFWLLFSVGMPVFERFVVIEEVVAGSPAQSVGILPGDKVLRLDNQPVTWASEVTDYVQAHSGTPVEVAVERNGNTLTFEVTPNPLLGVKITNISIDRVPWWQAPFRAVKEVLNLSVMMVMGLGQLLWRLLTSQGVGEAVAGPVGIYKLSEFYRLMGWRYLLQFVGLLSVNLGLINLLPLPALDGGRLMFIGWEMLTKKRLSPKIERLTHSLGFILLIVLMALVTFKDIRRFF